MIVRRWLTGVDEARAAEYEDFARRRSVPMFLQQPGFAGALFGTRSGERIVITLWDGRAAVDALETSESYQDTLAAIGAGGFLQGPSTTEVFELQGAVLDPCLIETIDTWWRARDDEAHVSSWEPRSLGAGARESRRATRSPR